MDKYTPILQWIDTQKQIMIDNVISWSNINSGSQNIDGINATLLLIKKSLPQEWNTQIIHLSSTANALHISTRPNAKIKILFSGHADTVYSKQSPFQSVKYIDDNTLNGPGVTDMKGGLCILLKSIEAFEKFSDKSSIGWEVFINPDEETGSNASRALLEKFAKRNDIGLVYEPSFADGTLVSARKGVAHLTLSAHGKSAHSGRDFHQGRNAIVALTHLISPIDKLNYVNSPVTINIGRIEGGGPTNIVPDLAVCYINIRFDTEEDFTDVKDKILAIIENTKLDGILFKHLMEYSRPPKIFDEDSKKIYEAVKLIGRDLGLDICWKPSGGASDANNLGHAGLPTIDSLGVVGGNIHTHDEYLKIDSLTERTKLSALFLMKIASGEISVPTKVKREVYDKI